NSRRTAAVPSPTGSPPTRSAPCSPRSPSIVASPLAVTVSASLARSSTRRRRPERAGTERPSVQNSEDAPTAAAGLAWTAVPLSQVLRQSERPTKSVRQHQARTQGQRQCPDRKNRSQACRTTSSLAEQARAGDGLQRPLVPRSRFQPRLTR